MQRQCKVEVVDPSRLETHPARALTEPLTQRLVTGWCVRYLADVNVATLTAARYRQ